MRKILITAFLASTIFTACSDAYDIEQPGFVTEEAAVFRNPDDVIKGVKALYASFPGESEVNFTSYYTDELGIGLNNAGQGINDGSYAYNLLAGNGSANSMWANYYNVVNRANRILNRIEELLPTVDDAGKAKLNSSKAELFGLRAYSHYKLFAFFTPDYTNPSGLSVIKFDFLQTDNYSRFEKRSTVSEIVAFIESDIQQAKNLGGIASTGSGFASNDFLESILIKMYSMVQSPSAYTKLEESFNRLTEGGRTLGTYDIYLTMFGNSAGSADPTEGIFKLNRVSTDGSVTSGVASAWYAVAVDPAEQVYMEMGRSLYNELDKLDPAAQGTVYDTAHPRNDIRYVLNVLNGSRVATNYATLNTEAFRSQDVLLIGKYTGITNRPLMNDVWVFRFTDMLLSLAEKRAFDGNLTGTIALGDYSNVESIIYNIRANRNLTGVTEPVSMPTNFSSAQQAYARILEERRMEFAFEAHRYLDMKRLGVKAGSSGFVKDPQDCAVTNVCSLAPTSHKLTMPIPRPEMMANPNMVQNPGY